MNEKVLVIGAHPDDETYGLGGTIKLHTMKGDEVHVLIVTDGSSSQYDDFDEMIERKKIESKNAIKLLGVKEIFFSSFPDMRLDTVSHVDINRLIEKKIKEFKPSIVYTHHWGDVNKDHRMIYESTMVATRPSKDQPVKKLITYETPSSTEWMLPRISDIFIPNMFVDITKTLNDKIEAVKCYNSEIRDYPHPRSPRSVEYYAKSNGSSVGMVAAERFTIIRNLEEWSN